MTAYYLTYGIVVFSRPHGESDKMLSCYTKDFGRIDVYAKGVRLQKSKLNSHLNTFSYVRLMLTRTGDTWRLLDAAMIGVPPESKFLSAHMAQFFMRVVSDSMMDPLLWQTVQQWGSMRTRTDLFLMKIQTLKICGLLPEYEVLRTYFTADGYRIATGGCRDTDVVHKKDEEGIERLLAAHMV